MHVGLAWEEGQIFRFADDNDASKGATARSRAHALYHRKLDEGLIVTRQARGL
jgi:hypothetical protein